RRLRLAWRARGDPVAGEGGLALEALADRCEHRHLPVGPLDPAHALGRECDVLDVMPFGGGHLVLSVTRRAGARAFVVPSRGRRGESRRATSPRTHPVSAPTP